MFFFYQIPYKPLFLFERKRGKKHQKSLQDLPALSVQIKTERARLSPPVIFARTSQKFGGTARRGNASQARYNLQTRLRRDKPLIIGATSFAVRKKSANRKNAPWLAQRKYP